MGWMRDTEKSNNTISAMGYSNTSPTISRLQEDGTYIKVRASGPGAPLYPGLRIRICQPDEFHGVEDRRPQDVGKEGVIESVAPKGMSTVRLDDGTVGHSSDWWWERVEKEAYFYEENQPY